jgi:hypothetical protein
MTLKQNRKTWLMLLVLGTMLTLTGCVKSIKGVPCNALREVFYESIEPIEAEEEVLRNNAVILELCDGN